MILKTNIFFKTLERTDSFPCLFIKMNEPVFTFLTETLF